MTKAETGAWFSPLKTKVKYFLKKKSWGRENKNAIPKARFPKGGKYFIEKYGTREQVRLSANDKKRRRGYLFNQPR